MQYRVTMRNEFYERSNLYRVRGFGRIHIKYIRMDWKIYDTQLRYDPYDKLSHMIMQITFSALYLLCQLVKREGSKMKFHDHHHSVVQYVRNFTNVTYRPHHPRYSIPSKLHVISEISNIYEISYRCKPICQ